MTSPGDGLLDTLDDDRLLPLEAVHNFRDLGGYRTLGPIRGVVRPGLLFRADSLNRLTEADIETVRALGLRTVIDLRTETEVVERGRFPLDQHPAAWHHLSILDVTWTGDTLHEEVDVTEFLMTRYLEMAGSGAQPIVELFEVLAGPGALPAVFHCAAGKDRTGVVAALVLGALGVPDDQIVADYALTRAAMARVRAWAAAKDEKMVERIANTPAAFLAAEPAAMEGFLALLRAGHGSAEGYLTGLGVPAATLTALREALVEPAG